MKGIAISTWYPEEVIRPAESQIASHDSSSLSSPPEMSVTEESICTPSGLTKNWKPRRWSSKVSRRIPTLSSRNAWSRSERWARISAGRGSAARKAA